MGKPDPKKPDPPPKPPPKPDPPPVPKKITPDMFPLDDGGLAQKSQRPQKEKP